jgi:DNA primase
MTEEHLKTLKRFTGDVRLSFDADRAGIAATERVIPLAQKVGVALKIITINDPDAKDPDELIRKDVNFWNQAIEAAQHAPDWLIDRYKEEVDLTTAAGKKVFTDALLTTIRRLSDPVEQEHYLKAIAKLTDTSLEAVQAKFSRQPETTAPLKRQKSSGQPIDKDQLEYQRLQDHFLSMILLQPKTRNLADGLAPQTFTNGPPRELFKFLSENPNFKGDPKIAEQLQPIGDYVKIVTLQFEELYQDLQLADLIEQAAKLKQNLIKRYVKIQNHKLAIAMQTAKDDNELNSLVQKADKLNELIKH